MISEKVKWQRQVLLSPFHKRRNSDCEPLAFWFRRTKPGTSWDLSPVALPSTDINGKPSLVWLPKNYSIGMELTQRRSAQLPSTPYCTVSRKSKFLLCTITQKGIPPHPAKTRETWLKVTRWLTPHVPPIKQSFPWMKFPCFSKALVSRPNYHSSNVTPSADLETEKCNHFWFM